MHQTFLRETAGVLMRAGVVVLTIVGVIVSLSVLYESESGVSDGSCNIAVFPVEGTILPFYGLDGFDLVITPDRIEAFMDAAEEDTNIDAVLVEINSPGGTPVASARIAERFKNSPLPVVGLVGDVAASGGYMVAAATDFLIASPLSSVGGIGVNMSYVEESEKNKEEGLTYVQLTTGEFKDIGSPNRPITEEERALLESDLELVHEEFVSIVADYRDLEASAVSDLANGATMPGVRALESGLIDSLGGRSEAHGIIASILDVSANEITFCEYRSPFLPF